jgi:hypothetical protein
LTSAEYKLLGGPPLAPRNQFSRVITNYKTDHANLRPGLWQMTFWWQDVVSTQGTPFLQYHFNGEPLGKNGPSITRDLRGIRPDGQRELMTALDKWSADVFRKASGVSA